MGITGLNINIQIGPYTVNRCPYASLTSRRGAVADQALLIVPDQNGEIGQNLKVDDQMKFYWAYRGGPFQNWVGRVTQTEAQKDALRITALGPGLEFIKTKVVECFHYESSVAVVKRLMALASITPKKIIGPDEILPHLIFSGQRVYECFQKINQTLEETFGHNLSTSPYWADENGQGFWGDFALEGDNFILESGFNLISHNPYSSKAGRIMAVFCPGLKAGQLFTLKDQRRGLVIKTRATMVKHEISPKGNLSTIDYGLEQGY